MMVIGGNRSEAAYSSISRGVSRISEGSSEILLRVLLLYLRQMEIIVYYCQV